MKKILIGSFTAILVFGSCLKNSDSQYTCNSNYDPCALKAPASETAIVKAYLDAHSSSIYKIADTMRHCSGMYYIIDSAGSGNAPEICSNLYVRYKGMLMDSTVFDSTATNPAYFSLSQVIAGFKNVLPLIKPGGGMHLFIPPTLAYGSQSNGKIPANATLIFQVGLVGVVQ